MKWIIIDTRKNAALYGFGGITLTFSTDGVAFEVAKQFFKDENDFRIVSISL